MIQLTEKKKMKTRYKITAIISGIIVAMMIGMTSATTCIYVEDSPRRLGSENACGPWLTYEVQKLFALMQ